MSLKCLFPVLLTLISACMVSATDSTEIECPHFSVIDKRHGLPESLVRDIMPLPDGKVAVALSASIDILDGDASDPIGISAIPQYPLPGYDGFRELIHTSDPEILWLKNRGSILAFSYPDMRPVTDMDSLFSSMGFNFTPVSFFKIDNAILAIDKTGMLHSSEGSESQAFTTAFPSDGSDELPQKIAADPRAIYMCYLSGKVRAIDRTTGQTLFSISAPPSHSIMSLNRGMNICLHAGYLYIARNSSDETRSIIHILDITRRQWLSPLMLPCRTSDMCFGHDGKCLIVGNGGLIKMTAADGTLSPHTTWPAPDDLSAMAIDRHGGMWLGTAESGIIYCNERRFQLIKPLATPYTLPVPALYEAPRLRELASCHAPAQVNCSALTPDGMALLGTRSGLMIFNDSDSPIARIGLRQGLTSDNIQAIAVTDSIFWVTTSSDLLRIARRNADEFCVSVYGRLDGLILDGKELRPRNIGIDRAGLAYIGYPGGSFIFNPDSLSGLDRPVHIVRPLTPSGLVTVRSGSAAWPVVYAVSALVAFVAAAIFLTLRYRRRHDTRTSEPASDEDVPDSVSISDRMFMSRLTAAVTEHMADSSLSVASLSSLMAMDRTVLYRKAQHCFGMSPSAYIRELRIEEAARLLRDTDLLIGEIAERTGFSSARYFTQAFKEAKDMSPTSYRNKSPGSGTDSSPV